MFYSKIKKVIILVWILTNLIKLYQKLPLHAHSKCRFYPTCSNYMSESLKEYGFFKGTYLGIKRIIRCHPFGKYGYDPVPKKKEIK